MLQFNSFTLLMAALSLSVLGWPTEGHANQKQASTCDAAVMSRILDERDKGPIHLTCSVTLPKNTTLYKSIIFEGSAASRATLDCNGSVIDTSAGQSRMEKTAIIVRSRKRTDGHWDAPLAVTVKNCTIKGFMRVYGLDENANGSNMRASSFNATHTEFAQASAPKRTSFLNLSIVAPGGAPLYIGPGVTWTTLAQSKLSGYTTGTAVYLDAESGRNSITNNLFSISTKSRELIAVDGSTRNEIIGNIFKNPVNGGIFLYRNCGEGGVIRHQRPNFNVISNNTFEYAGDTGAAKPAVWLGSRGGKQKFCFSDPRARFGSSASPMDLAQKNTVTGNRFIGGNSKLIRNTDPTNIIERNSTN